MEDAGTEFGLPRRFAPRNDEDWNASHFLSRNDETNPTKTFRTFKPSSLRGAQPRGNPSALVCAIARREGVVDCHVATLRRMTEIWGLGYMVGSFSKSPSLVVRGKGFFCGGAVSG
jgi:hypothetical protein